MTASPNELTYFLELCQTLNFSRASERLGISQPSLSVAIKRLEQSIGVPMFYRSKTGVSLTPAGKRLQVHGRQLLQLWDNLKAESLASHHEVQGSVTIGCHSAVAKYNLPTFLPQLLIKYPRLDVQLKHDISRKILEKVINLSIDIGIVVNPVRHPDLVLTKLYQDRVCFWCDKKTKSVDTLLNDDNMVIICDPELTQAQALLRKIKSSTSKNQRVLASSSFEVIASLAAHQSMIGILPESVVMSVAANILKPIESLPSYHDEIYLAYRYENRDICAIKEIIAHLKKSSKQV